MQENGVNEDDDGDDDDDDEDDEDGGTSNEQTADSLSILFLLQLSLGPYL